MKRLIALAVLAALCLSLLAGCGQPAPSQSAAAPSQTASQPAGSAPAAKEYPAGKMTFWTYGMPEYMKRYFDGYIAREGSGAQGVEVEMVNYSGEAEVRQQVMMSLTAGSTADLPTAISTFPVSMQVLAENGILKDITDQVQPYLDQFIPGAFDQATYNGRIYGIPYALQPKMLFYNNDLFEEYGIDPARMSTMDGYIEVGKELLEKSGGKVQLSYVDPGSYTWRYWFRRGLMPQAGANIWSDDGASVVFDTDPGTKLAFSTFQQLFEGGMLYNAATFQPAQYEAAREGKIATFYIESFWDSYLRSNLADMSGSWRSMPAPVFSEVGTAGAQAIGMYCIVNKENDPYTDLFVDMMLDFNLNTEARNAWSDEMIAEGLPTEHPITKDMLADPYWSQPSDYYGGESYKQMVTKAYENQSDNLPVTENDAEADTIISSELEKYVAGSQDMDTTIQTIGKLLRQKLNLK